MESTETDIGARGQLGRDSGRIAGAHRYQVRRDGCGSSSECAEGESLLSALHRLDRSAVLAGCEGGGCGVCKVRILAGTYALGAMSRAHVSLAEEAMGYALACRAFPQSDLVVQVVAPPARGAERLAADGQ